ncbi:hypothetical protein CNR22_01080 [Sphingobacteriaceae bacterium]|nr:hypothetical protein CNR22_01080 [Sphingobacteriaceae bacterium]
MKVFFFFALFSTFSQIHSQSLANYSSARNTSVTYTSINVAGSSFASWRNQTSNTQDDNRSDFTNIGFDFWYNGIRYTQFSVSTNGFLDFSTSTDDGGPQNDDFGYDNTAFTAANAANATRPAVAPFYDDLTAQGGTAALGNSIKYLVTGSAPNRTLTVEWINMAVYNNTTPSLNFQVKLIETTGQIIVHYGTMSAGSNTFSYCMGLNGPTVSNTPTAAQLKMLQTANSTTLNNTVQNNLSAMPTSASNYIFTPVAPSSAPGSLTFSGVSQTGTTLNWTDLANNERGYVVYYSTNNSDFDFLAQTAVNATSYAATGLLPSTTYYWRIYAVTEGALSAALTGTQATTAAGNKVSVSSGNWGTAGTWSPTGVPTAADNVTIANGHSVNIIANAVCNNLTVGAGSACTLNFSGATARTLLVNNNVTINSSAVLTTFSTSNVTHTITLEGNIVNNGVLNLIQDANSLVDVIFDKDGNQTVSGTGATTAFNRINMSLGSVVENTLEISSSNFSAASNFLDLISGTLKLSTVNAVNITPFTAATTMAANTAMWLNSANLTVNTGAGITLYGNIVLSNGILNVGNAADEDLVSNGGAITISGGTLNVAGKLDGSGVTNVNNICDFNISGGTLVVPTFGSTNTSIAPFHIASAGSTCNMTGGTIIIRNEGGTGAQNLGFVNVNTNAPIVTGGTLQIGNASTSAAQIMNINTDTQIQNLLLNSANATGFLITNSLTVADKVTIAAGTLNANNLNMAVGGNWSNSGTFTPGTALVNFNGTSAQAISKTGGETFNTVMFSNAGVKTFGSNLTANANFSISSGASVDVTASNFTTTVKGNFINSGTFNARNGLVLLNGTSAQSIGGSSATDFYNLTLNNTTGASLAHAENLKGTLTLSNGIFNATGQVFTMISDATGTARIAQITGTGDYTGNVTAQRFAPGGTTGWAFLGSPISSALTLADWDDNIYISCNSCPDGSSAGFLSIYNYDETASGIYDDGASYIPLTGVSDAITPGKGYWVYLGTGLNTTSDITLDLTGTPRKFNYTIPLNYTNFGSTTNDGWNLISNPYPSPVSWASLRGTTTNLDNAIYVYNADLNSGSGGFASYVNGISSPAIASGGVGDVIAMGQGFYVHSTGATGINATEANKVAGNPTFLKPANPAATRLTLLGANNYEDETVLYYQAGANTAFDLLYDSYKMRGQDLTAASIALENDSDVFQINGIAPVIGTFTCPLKTLTGVSGTYTITARDIHTFPNGACITLYDKFTGTTTDLKSSDYVFNLSDTTTVSRFVFTITYNTLSLTETLHQPTCEFPVKGSITAIGNSAGPWNYYWTSNGSPVKTSLNKAGADTLTNLANGNFELSVNTVGMCDFKESNYLINQQISAQAQFTSVDTIYLDQSSSIQFTNTSLNANAYAWDFGTGLDYSTTNSPSFSYNTSGVYTVNLLVTSSTGCQDTAYKVVTVLDGMVGLQAFELNAKEFKVKTLGNNLFVIEARFDEELVLQSSVTDVSGKEIANYGSLNTKNLNLEVDLKGLAKGVYFLNILSQNSKKVVKLPVQ